MRKKLNIIGQKSKKAFSLKKAPCVAITINSPGGSPVQSHLIHDQIKSLAKKHKKKVYVL